MPVRTRIAPGLIVSVGAFCPRIAYHLITSSPNSTSNSGLGNNFNAASNRGRHCRTIIFLGATRQPHKHTNPIKSRKPSPSVRWQASS